MFLNNQKSIIVRFFLLIGLICGTLYVLPTRANAVTAYESVEVTPTSVECIPGEVWTWTTGPSQPETARQAEVALKERRITAAVTATAFGEKDACGNFELFSTDFAVTIQSNPALSTVAQKEFADEILSVLEQVAAPQLGNVQISDTTGNLKLYLGGTTESRIADVGSQTSETDAPIPPKNVYLLVYDPILSNGKQLSAHMGWNSASNIAQQIINYFPTVSNNQIHYNIAQTNVITDTWPVLQDGYSYTETEYFDVLAGRVPPHSPSMINYDKVIDDFGICQKVNNGEIDELWMFGAPWFGFYESRLVGPGAYVFNSPPMSLTHGCNKLVPIMGLVYERGLAEAIHSFGHRAEASMTRVYGSWQENRTAHNWDRFGLVKAQSPDYSYSGCGSIHYPPNGTSAYNYNNPGVTLTNCEDFLNYPDLSDPLVVAQPVTCTLWNCDHLAYLSYWFSHFPSKSGCGPDSIASNWWVYFADLNLTLSPSTPCSSPPPCPTITNWKGEYWTNSSFIGYPALCRDDQEINFLWGDGSPDPSIALDNFSARWTRNIFFNQGMYRFHIMHDDGARVYIDNVLKIDLWGTCCTWSHIDIPITNGEHNVRMDLFENSGGAIAQLWWEYVSPLPSTSTATPTSTATKTPTATQTATATQTPSSLYKPLYLSLTNNQTIGGIASADEDILRFDASGNWSLVFDGSDVGVGSPDLFAFSIVDADTLLMSFSSTVTVNGITAAPQDVLRFDASSLGSITSGSWSLYFDGSDVGLDTSQENIDSLTLLPDGRLLLSTIGNPSVPGLPASSDEDVLAFRPTALGATTSGSWSLYFDGSDVGLGESNNEDVDALDVTANGNIYLSTLGDFGVSGLSGADEDVFVCMLTSIGDVTVCNYSPSLYFDGSIWGLSGNDVDAFNFLASGPTPTAVPSYTPTWTPSSTSTGTAFATSTPTATSTPPTFTPTATSTPSPISSTFTFTALADTYVNAGSPAANYGSSTTLRADASPDLHSYLRFNVQGLNGTVKKATLRIFANSASSQGCVAHRVSNNTWTESTVNYGNAPALAGTLGSSGSFGASSWISIDVTSYITGNSSYSLALTTPSSTAISLASRETGANAPQLIIETAP